MHEGLAYSLTYNKLPSGLLPQIWDDLLDADVEHWRGGLRRLLHTEGKVLNARVRHFSGREDWNEYCWGPLDEVRAAMKPGAFGTDWIVKYVVPQLEFMLAQKESSEVIPWEERIVVDKTSDPED